MFEGSIALEHSRSRTGWLWGYYSSWRSLACSSGSSRTCPPPNRLLLVCHDVVLPGPDQRPVQRTAPRSNTEIYAVPDLVETLDWLFAVPDSQDP